MNSLLKVKNVTRTQKITSSIILCLMIAGGAFEGVAYSVLTIVGYKLNFPNKRFLLTASYLLTFSIPVLLFVIVLGPPIFRSFLLPENMKNKEYIEQHVIPNNPKNEELGNSIFQRQVCFCCNCGFQWSAESLFFQLHDARLLNTVLVFLRS